MSREATARARILLVNVHSALNLGDAGIMQATLARLRGIYPQAEITVVANDPESWRGCGADAVVASVGWWLGDPVLGRWRAILWRGPLWVFWMALAAGLYRWFGRRWRWGSAQQQATQAAYYGADRVVSGGGGNLYAARRASPALWAALAALAWAMWLGKPVTLLPQSLGPIEGGFQRWMARALLTRAERIWVREPRSLAFAREVLGLAETVQLLPDLALGLPSVASRPLPEGCKVAICPMDRGAQQAGFAGQAAYEQALVACGVALQRTWQAHLYLVAQVFGPSADQDDRRVAHRLAAELAAQGVAVTVIEDCRSPAAVQAVYAAMDLVIATRMHGAIFALTGGVPVVALGYQPKSCGLMSMIGLGDYCRGLDAVDADMLVTMAQAILAEPGPVRASIAAAMQPVRDSLATWELGRERGP